LLFILAQVLFISGDFFYYTYDLSFPSFADGLYIAYYPLQVAGLVLLIRSRTPGKDWPSLLDALIISVGFGLLSWIYLIEPYTHDADGDRLSSLVSMAYPAMDLLLLAVAARMVIGKGSRPPAFYLLAASILCLVLTDVVYGAIELDGSYGMGSWLDVGWMSAYLLWGAAALHPSMLEMSARAPVTSASLSGGRLLLLAAATLIAPATLIANSQWPIAGFDVPVAAAASAVLFVLVLVRMLGLVSSLKDAVGRHERAERRETILRHTAMALTAASNTGDIRHAIIEGARDLTQGLENVDIEVEVGESQPLTQPVSLAPAGCVVVVLSTQASVYGRLVVKSTSPVPTDVVDGLHTLGAQVALALESAARKQAEVALAAARDAALEGSRLKSSFLATMSHEIRTPMNGVIGLTGLLLTTELNERQVQYAEGVRTAGEALLAIINDILDFSKVEAGKLELEEIDFDVVQIVEEAAVLVADAAQQKGVELLAYCSPDLPLGVRGDPSRIRQVLLNLVSNAVKFTQHGEVVVRGQLEDQADDGVVMRFEVSDTGAGIPEPSQRRLFDPFTQADSSTTREFGGTGLGLAISHRLVTAMGGEIGLNSEVGAGSTFWFTVPLRLALDPTRAVKRVEGRLSGLRALIVDDNATNRLILTEQLGAWGIRTDAVDSGLDALLALQSAEGSGDAYDLALLDFCMPSMDGLQLAAQISSDPALAATGLVLLTSAPDVTSEKAFAAGVSQCIPKPVRLSQLHRVLQSVQGEARGSREAAATVMPPAASRGHLLVVEDHPINQMVAMGIVESLGFTAEVASNGEEALHALSRRSFDAVLMDCHMPVMDGYTATRKIRQGEGDRAPATIIAMTAGAVEDDREKCLEAGMDDYVSKPVTPEALDNVLTHWLSAPREPARATRL
jgi:signal transduction histidine kinase/DNA-binding response OmpR family regulator